MPEDNRDIPAHDNLAELVHRHGALVNTLPRGVSLNSAQNVASAGSSRTSVTARRTSFRVQDGEGRPRRSTAAGRSTLLINNAGFAQFGALEEVDIDAWRDQYETSAFGLVTVTQAVLPSMRARRAGHVIPISSMGGHVRLPTMTAYASSKFAVEGIGEGRAKEVASLGIMVTIAEPAGFGTRFSASARPASLAIEQYEPARQVERDFAERAVRGDLERPRSTVVDVAGIPDPPRRLALGNYGFEMVRGKLAELAAGYDAWEHVTART